MLGLKFHVQNFYGTIYTYNFNHVFCCLFFITFAWDAVGVFFIRLHGDAIGVLNYCISIQKGNTHQKKKKRAKAFKISISFWHAWNPHSYLPFWLSWRPQPCLLIWLSGKPDLHLPFWFSWKPDLCLPIYYLLKRQNSAFNNQRMADM